MKPLVQKKFKKEFEAVLQTLDEAGCNNYWQVLRTDKYGVPQSRERVFNVKTVNDDLRNLTERECFRLMGFKDEEFDVIEGRFSSTELYTMAGNSIVVDVAEEVLCMLFNENGELILKEEGEKMNKNMFVSKMKLFGDTNAALAEAIGLSP